MNEKNKDQEWLPLLPLKDMVVFPNSVFPLIIGRELSIQAVQKAMIADQSVLVIAQKDNRTEEPEAKDFYRIGVISKILQLVKLPNGLLKVLVEGKTKARVLRMQLNGDYYQARYESLSDDLSEDTKIKANLRHLFEQFSNYVESNKNLSHEISIAMQQLETTNQKLHFIASHLEIKSSDKQKVLEKSSIGERVKLLQKMIASELEILVLQDDLNDRIKNKILKTQRNHFIHEQIRLLRDELGEDDEEYNDISQLEDKIKKSGMSEAAFQKSMEELNRLRMMSFMSPEASVTRTYLEWLVDVPWKEKSKSSSDIEKAKEQLNNDHYGLREVKERILDYIAVLKQTKSITGPILCLVGPPGVGKTSLGKSIANALGRNFARISLGGVRDEAEIRGHRKTYIGAMPGKVIQAMKKVGTINPVILLDEVDKMASDMRGDPASALLEVLDPAQNSHFMDHFLEVEYDLSKTLFICTANYYDSIPLPLLDRMEVIQLNSYVDEEKFHIAKDFLLPQIVKDHGLKAKQVKLPDSFIMKIIREYTREPGVRLLHQQLAKVVRKITRLFAEEKIKKTFTLTESHIIDFLGYPKFKEQSYKSETNVGVAIGLAWTASGGDILPIEVNVVEGKEKLVLTGKLGDVMKESAQAALSYLRANSKLYNIDKNFFENREIHIHVPEGAVPKDGPSAGITLASALLSAIHNKAPKRIAMTGEITLRGHILAIGGLKEKLMSAIRFGIYEVIIPLENHPDYLDIEHDLPKKIKTHFVKNYQEVATILALVKKNNAK